MRREVTLEEISDGRLYEANDMVKADCQDCKGCFDCCTGMGDSVVLDPLDVWRLSQGLHLSVDQLLAGKIELGVTDGNILPHLRMTGAEERCVFLNGNGRCSIHSFRPGFCRLFPLGRYYEDGGFKYILQIHECKKTSRSKIKVRKWVDTPDFRNYEKFVCDWHYFLLDVQAVLYESEDSDLIRNLNMYVVEPEFLSVDWELNSAGKNGYPFYMEKEIMEQPEAIKNTIKDRIVNGLPDFTADGVPDSLFTDCDRICVVACGTAMHAGLVAQALVKSIVHVQMDVELASEFMYSDPVIDEKTLVIAVSQSGETIDTLEALKYAKRQGAKCLSIINVKGSSIARESDYVLYTAAGPEIAVASTKAYTTQLSVFYLVVAKMALLRGVYTEEQTKSFIAELERVPEVMQKVLEKIRDIHVIAKKILEAKDLFMIGRGLDYSILLEGSLKLKEVSYIHSEAYASGELKHGPIALITTNTPVVATVTQEKLMSKELSNIKEVKSRGADIVLFIKEALSGDLDTEYQVIKLPDMQDEFMVLPASVALQLLAYYVSSDKGFDVDKPRNLAKVVTVE